MKRVKNKVKALVYAKDQAGTLLWNIISPVLTYSAQLHGEIADDIVSIDQAMKWASVGKWVHLKRGMQSEWRNPLPA